MSLSSTGIDKFQMDISPKVLMLLKLDFEIGMGPEYVMLALKLPLYASGTISGMNRLSFDKSEAICKSIVPLKSSKLFKVNEVLSESPSRLPVNFFTSITPLFFEER